MEKDTQPTTHPPGGKPTHPAQTPRKHLFLFDVDGVLVEARGYLRALQDTVAHFTRCMGVGKHAPSETEVRAGEAYGLTSEWDSSPAYILALLLERVRREPALALPARWDDALDVLSAHPLPLPHPDYMALVARVGARKSRYKETSHAIRATLWEEAQTLSGLQREAVGTILDELLAHTHDFDRAPITQYFQHLVIGSAAIMETYGVPARFESAPYLIHNDVPALAPEQRARVRAAAAAGYIHPVIYTARPSLPPMDTATPSLGYSPEAELARTLVGLDGCPLIGLGQLQWLATQCGGETAQMVKPSPVQALAAIGAAVSGREATALEAAWAFQQTGQVCGPLADLGSATVHIFEDTVGGMGAVYSAVEALRGAGVDVQWQPYGITPATGTKAEAMEAQNIPTYRSVNAAVDVALQRIL